MNFIIEYWYIILAAIAALAVAIVACIRFFKTGSEEQINKVKEWLLYATTLAEKELGSGTGKLKLRYVYDMFVTKFTWLADIISFERFSELVDDVLVDMNELLKTNTAIKQYVTSEEGDVITE